ncbi:TIGR02099 family protein [Paraburkholderia sp. MMS20-SJTN17]|uniref:TIGR02099 family protein n=1 Tax=Paraburkholderia translucens TaxID=2886945 RepID=A0ABS8K9E6_9BURK|nr:YhdP family protein [Paraburkholderia sp. MMS20-SJTN17]MCC8401349.1 TIGR02099 family protein [Paraburkholderia sp. MMS20-SJTN17]
MSERNESADPQDPSQVRHLRGSDHIVLRRTLRVLATLALVLYFIATGLFLGLRYVVLPRADLFRPRIEAAVSDALNAQFTIGRLAPHWSGFQPGLDVTNLVIRDHDGRPALTIPHATATMSWRSLWLFHPALSSLIVDQPDVLVSRSEDGVLSVAGVPVPTRHSGNAILTTWLLRQQAIVVRGGVLRWRDATRKEPELALRDIRIAILNDGYDHRMALQAPPDGQVLKGPIDFRMHFRHALLSAIGKPINWNGQAYVSTGPVDLPTLARYVAFPIETFAGRVDNAIWIDFREGRMTEATGQLDGNDVALRVHPTQPKLLLPVAHFRWRVGAGEGDYTLQLSDLRAELGQPPLEDGTPLTRILHFETLDGRYRTASLQHGQLLRVSGDRVDLGILAEFSRALPLPRRLLNELVRINPRGLVANYVIEVERSKPESGEFGGDRRPAGSEPIERYRFKGDLQGISFAAQEPGPGLTPRGHPRAGVPGIENLWGNVDADEKGGRANLDTSDVAITLPGVFDDPRLTFAHLHGRADWTMGAKAPGDTRPAFAVKLNDFGVSNPDVEATVTASYSNPGHGRGSLDLKADFQRAQVTRIARYLPTAVSEKLRIYLGHGLQAGVSRGGTIEVHGDLTKFPYARDPDAGIFHIVAPVTGGKFDPTPFPPRKMRNGTPNVWPPLDGIDGVFELKQNLLRFDIDRGRYKRVALTGVNGRIDDLGTRGSNLIIQGNGRGPLADMLDYVNGSSLGIMARHQTEKIRAEGSASLALKLTIPRTPKPHIGVEGALGFQNNRLSANNVPPLSQLTGRVRFTERSAETERLSGRFLGGDVHANGGFRQDGTYALALNGHIAVAAARELNLRGPATQVLTHMSGSAPYALSVTGVKGRLPQVSANSDLTGLALDFPAPFKKAAGTPMPLRFSVNPATAPGEAGLERAELTFGPVAAAYLLRYQPRVQPNTPPTVVRGAIGVNRPADLPSEGVVAAVDVKEFHADAWRALIAQLRAAAAGANGANGSNTASSAATPAATPAPAPNPTLTQFLPNRFALHIDKLTLLKRHWDNVIVGASHTDRTWQANIASNQVSGHVSWLPGATPDSPGELQARFARIVIPSVEDRDLLGPAMSAPALNMPSIDLVVNELIVRDRNVGRLEVDAHNFDENGVPVWQLDKLVVTNPTATLTATANWRTSTELPTSADETTPRRTVFDFKLDVKDAGAMLERFGLPRTLKGGTGSLAGKAVWQGGPTTIDYSTLNGNLALDLRHGQILKVDPGVATLLGVLSLQSLARIATLDFRDVIGEGLPFSSVTGTAQIHDGIARTDNFRMVTAPARAEMVGSVDIAQRTQDLHLHVVPTVSAGSAVIVATIINPLIGLGALVADVALSHGVSQVFAREYAITGSWSKPHIERVTTERGKIDVPASTVEAH